MILKRAGFGVAQTTGRAERIAKTALASDELEQQLCRTIKDNRRADRSIRSKTQIVEFALEIVVAWNRRS